MKMSNRLLIIAGAVIVALIFTSIVISRGTVDELLRNQRLNASVNTESAQFG